MEEDFCWNCCQPIKKEELINPSFCSKNCKDAFKEESRKEAKEIEEQTKKDNAIIEESKKHLTKKQIEIFEADLKDIEYIWGFRFVDKPKGEHQRNPFYEEWVDQRSVGDSGDSFAGEVYIKLSNGKYLEYSYNC